MVRIKATAEEVKTAKDLIEAVGGRDSAAQVLGVGIGTIKNVLCGARKLVKKNRDLLKARIEELDSIDSPAGACESDEERLDRIEEGSRMEMLSLDPVDELYAVLDVSVVCDFLAASTDPNEVKQILDQAEAVRVWSAKQKDAEQIERSACESRLRAERRLGELLGEKSKGGRGKKAETATGCDSFSRMQVSRFRKISAIPADVFETEIGSGKPVTTARFLRIEKGLRDPNPEPKKAEPKPVTVDVVEVEAKSSEGIEWNAETFVSESEEACNAHISELERSHPLVGTPGDVIYAEDDVQVVAEYDENGLNHHHDGYVSAVADRAAMLVRSALPTKADAGKDEEWVIYEQNLAERPQQDRSSSEDVLVQLVALRDELVFKIDCDHSKNVAIRHAFEEVLRRKTPWQRRSW